jgi:SAM-dependent methyltransferase
MTSTDAILPEALRRGLSLFAQQPARTNASNGYLDLLGHEENEAASPIQSLWTSGIGAALYDPVQALSRQLFTPTRLPAFALDLPAGGNVLDIGCGPGNLTAELAGAVGPSGLALGLDVSVPMLERAVRTRAGDNVGFLRADARALPFRDGAFDAVTSLLALQLIPEPLNVLTEMTRVLAPGAKLTVLVPSATGSLFHLLSTALGNPGKVEFFDPDDVANTLHDRGMTTVHTRQNGSLLWVTARKTGTASS